MERKVVESSNLSEIGYDPETLTLEIQFKKGSVYQYYDVPVEVYDEFMESKSLGKSFSELIRGGDFHYKCVGK